MSRYIDAYALIKQLKSSSAYNDYEWSMYADGFIEDIENAPSIDIVFCKECKYAHMTYGGDCKYCDMWKDDDDFCIELYLDGDFYCSYGEREGE